MSAKWLIASETLSGEAVITQEVFRTLDPNVANELSALAAREDRAPRSHPLRGYRRLVFVVDVVIVIVATLIGYVIRFGIPTDARQFLDPVSALGIGLALLWLLALYLADCYDLRFLGAGTDEFRKLISGTALLFAFVAGLSYLLNSDVSRAFVFISLPIGLVALIIGRWSTRKILYRRRARGRDMMRTVIVGHPDQSLELVDVMREHSYTGYELVAVLPPPIRANDADWVDETQAELMGLDADAVAVLPSEHISSDTIKRLAWSLEGLGVDLLVAPSVHEVAGPRISMRPAAGLPLIHLEEPGLSPLQGAVKRTMDVVLSTFGIIVLTPLYLLVSLAILLTTGRPILFRQTRIGKNGAPFKILKFRTMRNNADALREQLRDEEDLQDPGFKLDGDPRVTPIGRFLRRWSIDELPQLGNVLIGEMSMVGPRPHPIDDVVRYEKDAFRRLLVKPGITGLWQVEGRSDLAWEDTVKLDLYYVENWSVAGDIVLLFRTVKVVISGRGAS